MANYQEKRIKGQILTKYEKGLIRLLRYIRRI
jgi:hypothetical protein